MNNPATDLQFDIEALKHLKAREMQSLIKMNDLEATAAILAKYVTACPAEWGDPKSADTYLELPMRGETGSLASVIEALAVAVRGE